MPQDGVYNALEHGLKGDGATNDQPALAALVERLGKAYASDHHPRVIHCPPGEYLIRDATTVWKSGISLIGAGAGVTRFLLANPGNPEDPVALASFTETQHGASPRNFLAECTFASFEIDGSRVQLKQYNPYAKGLGMQFMLRARFRDLYIHDTGGTGLGCDYLSDSIIDAVLCVNCGRLNNGDQPGGAGIGIGIGGWGSIERVTVMACTTLGNATNGIFVELQKEKWPPTRGIEIIGCHATGNRFGISDWGADGLLVSACTLAGNMDAGYDVSAKGMGSVAGRGGLVTGCLIDANVNDGVIIGTPGPYTVRGNRISNNGRYGYCHHELGGQEEVSREVVLEGNDIWNNGLDGVRFESPLLDAVIVGNRVRNNGWQSAPGYSGEGDGVSYTDKVLHDLGANWAIDAHKGKTVSALGMKAIVVANNAKELFLAPHRPGAESAWKRSPPPRGTRYTLEAAPAVRAGIAIATAVKGAWIRGNRIWDNQERQTQTHALWTAPDGKCEDCRIEDNNCS